MARNGIISNGTPAKAIKPASWPHPDLKIPAAFFDDETLRYLIDEWIVPALVEEFLRCHNKLPSTDTSKDH
jgi:hypothetical protein